MIYGELTSPRLKEAASGAVALLPLAAIEQHGDHLPVVTDTAIVSEIASRVEKALPDQVALLPTLWCGSSHHHLGFPGTVSISSETYIIVLSDLMRCLLRAGFSRIVLLNGHGGNHVPALEAVYRVNLENENAPVPPWLAVATYWNVAAQELAGQTFMETPRLSHACEYETSLMLALRVDWVEMKRAVGHAPSRQSKFYDPLGYTPSRVAVSETFRQLSPNGALGSPEKATPEKGAQLFDLITGSMTEFLRDFRGWVRE